MCVYTRKQPLMGAFAHDKWACWPMAAHGLGVILMREHVGCRHTRATDLSTSSPSPSPDRAPPAPPPDRYEDDLLVRGQASSAPCGPGRCDRRASVVRGHACGVRARPAMKG
jgi:hypothetical protein